MSVADVLEYLAADMSIDEVLADFPYLEREDILACLAYAAERERERGQLTSLRETALRRKSSPSLVHRLADLFPNSAHVHNLGLGQADDATISLARDHDYVVVTKDADFRALRLMFETSSEPCFR